MENKEKQEFIKFLNYKVEPHVFKQEHKIIKLDYKRHNEEYEVIKKDVVSHGYQKSFKDFIYENQNPFTNDDKTNEKYGIAPKLQPLNKTIYDARATIDAANAKRAELERQIAELQNQFEQETKTEEVKTND